jgi:hypothetical protein
MPDKTRKRTRIPGVEDGTREVVAEFRTSC